VARLSRSAIRDTGSTGGPNILISPARLSCETIIERIPRARAQAPVHRSVVRSETSSRSGSSWSSSRRSERRAVIARYPPRAGILGPGTVITSPCSLYRRPGFGPGMTSTDSCPAAR
jgi:hypothetical protein